MSDVQLPEEMIDLENGNTNEQKITRQVKKFYERIQFPGRRPMEQDSLIFLRKFSQLVHRATVDNQPVRILDAGCGTGNTSLALAAQFRDVQFVGIDLSSTSVATATRSAREKNLSNLEFREWNLLDPLSEDMKFDIILCFGVLHHTAQMQRALDNLSAALLANGTLFLWVYGRHGRYFHSLNVELLSMLLSASPQREDDIDLTREFILKTLNGDIIKHLLGQRSEDPMLKQFYTDTTWISDQFLNPNEWLVDMKDIQILLKKSGLGMHEWVGVPQDLSRYFNSAKLEKCFNQLPDDKQLIAMDLLLKMDRYFLILKKTKLGN